MRIADIVHKPVGLARLLVNRYRFGAFGWSSRISKPDNIEGSRSIFIGRNVGIYSGCWLAARPLTGAAECSIVIEDGVRIGRFAHIYATEKIHISKNALIADKVYIADNQHCYSNPNVPVIAQGVIQKKPVSIGEGCWIGENVCVIGASVGAHSVIGANSVVTSDIPDYCVAVGAPARIVKRYDFEKETWRRTDSKGDFIK